MIKYYIFLMFDSYQNQIVDIVSWMKVFFWLSIFVLWLDHCCFCCILTVAPPTLKVLKVHHVRELKSFPREDWILVLKSCFSLSFKKIPLLVLSLFEGQTYCLTLPKLTRSVIVLPKWENIDISSTNWKMRNAPGISVLTLRRGAMLIVTV